MENVILTSLTAPEIKQLFRDELVQFFKDISPSTSPAAPVDPVQQFNISEVAEYLKCSKATIHNYKNNKSIPFHQIGRTVYFIKSEVDEALSSMTAISRNKKGTKPHE